MSMPGRDGLDLARALHGNPAYDALRLVMLTSATNPDPDEQERAGVVECLVKPVLAVELRAALLRHLAGVEPRPAAEPRAAAALVSSRRVLVVEDNPVNQLVAVGLLEALGYSARTADDGIEALAALEEDAYDAVLMDVQMPRMDGYTATRAIRAAENGAERVPVIAMTAAAVEGERERCMAAGMDDFLTKPVDPSTLAAVLDLWMPDGEPGIARNLTLVSNPPTPDSELLDGLARERLDELRDLDPGNTTYLDRAIGNFVANTPGTLETIRAAADAGDAAALKQVSHKLAGGALNLGVTAAGRTAQEIELVADTGSTDGAAVLVDRLEADLARGRAALLAYRATYSG
jgi:CheY-like chemotaxis protein/HPt (histidine-containing phosphotransfer) domain-containing protein